MTLGCGPAVPERVAAIMLSWHSLELVSCSVLQTLWAGYGHICAVTARATTDEAAAHLDIISGTKKGGSKGRTYPLILKLISPPGVSGDDDGDEGHLRKMLSYDVEQYFYTEVAPRLPADVAVAACLASTRGAAGRPRGDELKGTTATIMADLRPRYPVAGEKRTVLAGEQVVTALGWLAGFHSSSWRWLPDDLHDYVLPPLEEARRRKGGGRSGSKLWLNGGYTYLETRRREYADLIEDEDSEWRVAMCEPFDRGSSLSAAEMAAKFLTPSGRPIETYIHGDVKSENLFTNRAGDAMAFFDFQYVGLGLGVCDLAKLFTCSVPLEMLVDGDAQPLPDKLTMSGGEKSLLERYRKVLLAGDAPRAYPWDDFRRHWEAALVDWCRFQASWGFWGNTEWLEARVRSILGDEEWRGWLRRAVDGNGGG